MVKSILWPAFLMKTRLMSVAVVWRAMEVCKGIAAQLWRPIGQGKRSFVERE
jgi:hypothetical protein